ncbi:MAG TPA: NADP-dependent oxidoreductase [Candidatus Limnocylindrales bacterium]
MKAFVLPSADQPATIADLPEPQPGDDQVRVRITAASVNGFDVFEANGYLIPMMEHAFPTVIGRDFAGVVDSVGAGRADVAVGDEVFGFVPSAPPLRDGTYAEALVGGPDLVLAPKPSALPFTVAAAIPLAGVTALDAVDAVDIKPGDVVVVAGATGGVGSIALQLAAQRGARVIATARAGDEESFVRGLGAAETVDYTAGDVADSIRSIAPDGVAALIDVVSRDQAFVRMTEIVRDGGRISTTLGAADVEALARRNIRATNVMGRPTTEKLIALGEQVLAGTLRIEVQRTFPLVDAAAALAAFAAGTRGKIVLEVG